MKMLNWAHLKKSNKRYQRGGGGGRWREVRATNDDVKKMN